MNCIIDVEDDRENSPFVRELVALHGKNGINVGSSQVELGRAKEMLSHARWRAEREFPSQWGGAKININVTSKVEMSEALDTIAGELLDEIQLSS